MLDPFALADLPLVTLIIVAFFYVVLEMFKFASAEVAKRRARNALQKRLDYHITVNYGFYVKAFVEVHRGLSKSAVQEAIKPLPKPIPFEWGGMTVAPSALLKPTDIAVTSGYLDPQKIADQLDQLGRFRAGLTLYFIELMPLIAEQIELWNDFNDDGVSAAQIKNFRWNLLESLAQAMLVGHALEHQSTRTRIWKILYRQRPSLTVLGRNRALNDLFADLFADFYPLPPKRPAPKVNQTPSISAIADMDGKGRTEVPFDFCTESFEVLWTDQPSNPAYAWYALPAVLLGLFAVVIGTSDWARAHVFGQSPAPTATCETIYGRDGDVLRTKCRQTIPTDQMILKDGVVAPFPSDPAKSVSP